MNHPRFCGECGGRIEDNQRHDCSMTINFRQLLEEQEEIQIERPEKKKSHSRIDKLKKYGAGRK